MANDPYLEWNDPIGWVVLLQEAVKCLRGGEQLYKRVDKATAVFIPAALYREYPKHLKPRIENILNARGAVRKDYGNNSFFSFGLLKPSDLRSIAEDIFAIYETCLIDIGRMDHLSDLGKDYREIAYPKSGELRTFRPKKIGV